MSDKIGLFLARITAAGLLIFPAAAWAQETDAGGVSWGWQAAVFVGMALLLIILHIFICVWILNDAKALGIRAGGWAFFGAVPVIGLIGLFSYILSRPGSPAPLELPKESVPPVPDGTAGNFGDDTQIGPLDSSGVMPPPISGPADDLTRIIGTRVRYDTFVLLTQVSGDDRGNTYQVPIMDSDGRPVRVKLGREVGSPSDVVIPDDTISREHCKMYREDGKIVVHDLGSANGTFIARTAAEPEADEWGEKVIQAELPDRAWLKLGAVAFRVSVIDQGGN